MTSFFVLFFSNELDGLYPLDLSNCSMPVLLSGDSPIGPLFPVNQGAYQSLIWRTLSPYDSGEKCLLSSKS